MTRYDELALREARQAALQTLALAKWLQESAKQIAVPLEKEAKAWLAENDMDPGSRHYARIDDDQVATVSRSDLREVTNILIEDEDAFGAWLIANGHDNPFQMRLHDWARQPAFLEAVIKKAEGEVPDGVAVSKKVTGGSMNVRQSDTQREALERHIAGLRQISESFDALAEIESGDAA